MNSQVARRELLKYLPFDVVNVILSYYCVWFSQELSWNRLSVFTSMLDSSNVFFTPEIICYNNYYNYKLHRIRAHINYRVAQTFRITQTQPTECPEHFTKFNCKCRWFYKENKNSLTVEQAHNYRFLKCL